jgi:hypothetical protein
MHAYERSEDPDAISILGFLKSHNSNTFSAPIYDLFFLPVVLNGRAAKEHYVS